MFAFYVNAMPGRSGFQSGEGRGEGNGQGYGQAQGRGRCGPDGASFGAPGGGRCGPGGRGGPGGFGGPGGPGDFGPGGPSGRGGPPMRGGRMFDPGAIRLIVLDMIQENSRHGYEIIKLFEERIGGMYSPSPGVIYPILSMYEDMGYIASTPEGNKKLYAITDEGRAYLTQHQAYITHLKAQMAEASKSRNHGDIRESMQALRAVLIERVRHDKLDAAQLARIKEILATAQDQIQKL